MKQLVDQVLLKNRVTGEFEVAELCHGIDETNLSHIEGRWRPMFELRRAQAKASGESMSDINAEDGHWNWGSKVLAAISDPFLYDIFALECGGNTQALLLTCKGSTDCFSRHPEHPKADMVYVEFLATAPWNRPRLVAEPIYKGAGRVLIGTAVSLSLGEEFGGRIGLHSLLGSEKFYRDAIGMTDLGVDVDGPHKGLRYFELPESQVTDFLTIQH
ncbi:MAG: hypothetical protein OXE94_08430 [Aestuariivita sp.]|nr:hypothetical protein [Aestuariivita sp.]MCY4203443.1 hypothetical protein [Aestuariivita sp.]MCY4287270.1 hypothetical protein [Aestuariivita sp.]MCY4345199.1 hypothetical protein [Aestuariivita sp.]